MAGAAPAPYEAMIVAAAKAAGIPASLLREQLRAESGFNPDAHSPAGAEGIAQFMPATAAGLGLDPYDPQAAIIAAAKLDAANLTHFGGDVAKALAAYNAGTAAVDKYGGVPPFTETRNYVSEIMAAAGLPATVTPGASTETAGFPNPLSAVTDLPGQIVGKLEDVFWSAARPAIFDGVFVAAGAGLVAAGVWRAVKQRGGAP
jgi:hypothetical protein